MSKSSIRNKRCLVAGGGGSVGSELVRQLAPDNKVYILDLDETNSFDLAEELQLKGDKVFSRVGDITDRETVRDVFSDFKPQIVINAAARKHVKPMEEQPMEAVKTNIIGNYNLVDYSKRYEADKFVFISTDKVVNASSIMGATKNVAEIMTRNAGYVSVRFGNVMGSRGSVIPFWQNQADRGDPITVTDEKMERFMMTIPQAVSLVLKATADYRKGKTYILNMGKPVRVMDIARRVAEETNSEIKMIGKRPGEELNEKLMTVEEYKRAETYRDYWLV